MQIGLELSKLLQKSRGMAVLLDRCHQVLHLSLDLLFALPHLLDFPAQVPERCVQLTAKLANREVDHFRAEQLRLQSAEESLFEMIAANVEPVPAHATIKVIPAHVLRMAMGSSPRGDDEIPTAITALQKPTEQVGTRDSAWKKAGVSLGLVQTIEGVKPSLNFVPQIERHDGELVVLNAFPLAHRAELSSALIRTRDLLEF